MRKKLSPNRGPQRQVHVDGVVSPGAALAAMRKTFNGGKPKVLAPCPRCGKVLTARERRRACPAHQLAK